MLANTHSPDQERAKSRTVYVAEMQCFLCGNLAGAIESDHQPLPAACMWQPADGGPPRMVDWRQLRCGRCGGALLAESIDAVIRQDSPDDHLREQPRRGRPPKWLVEERQRQFEAAETRHSLEV